MTAFAAITINDGQATPVAHTFSPRRINDGIAKWQDLSGGIAVGFPTLTCMLREPLRGQKAKVFRAQLKVVVPVLETISNSTYSGILPAPTKGYEMVATVEFLIPERSTLQNRKDLRAYVANALAQADIKSLCEDLAMIF